jgi:tRNA U34 5-carboxymethylaminomethyl modifying GTPase MnmE/TrmE
MNNPKLNTYSFAAPSSCEMSRNPSEIELFSEELEEKEAQDKAIAAINECALLIASELEPIGMKDSVSALKLKIEELAKKDMHSTLVVVGDTGSGKSSLLNALLRESELLPTNGVGNACTGNKYDWNFC